MAEVTLNPSVFRNTTDKVAVVVGGANGIGAATVGRLYRAGAHVWLADLDEKSGLSLVHQLKSQSDANYGTVTFTKLDVTNYQDLIRLFEAAYEIHNKIDVAIFSTGITEAPGSLTGNDITLQTVKEEPSTLSRVISVNLIACLHFTRIALAFLKQGLEEDYNRNSKSLVLISSAAAFQESPGTGAYSASKAGMVGLSRSLQSISPARINTICPWATDTNMIAGHTHLFHDNGLPLQTADEVAVAVHQAAVDPDMHGTVVFVGGGKRINVEQGMIDTRAQWLGNYVEDLFARQAVIFEAKSNDWAKSGH